MNQLFSALTALFQGRRKLPYVVSTVKNEPRISQQQHNELVITGSNPVLRKRMVQDADLKGELLCLII